MAPLHKNYTKFVNTWNISARGRRDVSSKGNLLDVRADTLEAGADVNEAGADVNSEKAAAIWPFEGRG